MDKFIELENLLRTVANKFGIEINRENNRHSNFTTGQIINGLYQRELISVKQLRDLLRAYKIRNLAAHGRNTDRMDVRQEKVLEDLIQQLKKIE